MLFYNGARGRTPTHGGTANTRTTTPYCTSPNAVATVLEVMPLLEAQRTLLLPPLIWFTHLLVFAPCAVLRRVTFHTLPFSSTVEDVIMPLCVCTYYKTLTPRMGQGWTSLFTGISLQTFAVPYALSQLMCLKIASSITHLIHHQLICYAYGTPPTLHRGIAPLMLRDVCCSFEWLLITLLL